MLDNLANALPQGVNLAKQTRGYDFKDKGEVNQQRPSRYAWKDTEKVMQMTELRPESTRPRGHSVAERAQRGERASGDRGTKGVAQVLGKSMVEVGAGGRNGKMGAQISPSGERSEEEALAGREVRHLTFTVILTLVCTVFVSCPDKQ